MLGVVADPIDVIPDLPTPPEGIPDWLVIAIIITAVLGVGLVITQLVRNQSGGKH